MMPLSSCCGCLSVKTGTIIIGTLSMISTVLSMISIVRQICELQNAPVGPDQPAVYSTLLLLKLLVWTMLIYAVIVAIFSGLMIVGTNKKRSDYIFPWLAISYGSTIACVCLTLAIIIVTVTIVPAGVFVALFFIMVITSMLQIYFWMVVYTHYKELVANTYDAHVRFMKNGDMEAPPYRNV